MAQSSLVHVNIAKKRAPMSDPIMLSFLDALPYFNALAESSPGFIWRMKDEELSPEESTVFEQEFIVNMSVRESPERLLEYAYKSDHRQPMLRRRDWFVPIETANMALWWIEAGSKPSLSDAKRRLDHLTEHGESEYAFTFRKLFPPLIKT